MAEPNQEPKTPHPFEEFNYNNDTDDGICKECDGTGEQNGAICKSCGGHGYTAS